MTAAIHGSAFASAGSGSQKCTLTLQRSRHVLATHIVARESCALCAATAPALAHYQAAAHVARTARA
eukprot:CAMPEP_0206028938 /NCGR_PEP_ID=MMETSP1464-20131121/45856_1 /ASSEMBLY_ACC=CAM_ASM_001124 /TAXON_ID=119497 /ORGANISM="Exanthemachrysis gayraliae, Strain RCC1523" /LENGTH=66 /DNA_ID=CAMNT_0053403009 /DNA_START=109 /DNA_END=305 /DNA_ORIENTATION=+